MKMLLASDDLSALQPVIQRLVAWGIPLALQKPPDLSSYLEIWIQRDADFLQARTLLPASRPLPAAVQAPAGPLSAGFPLPPGAGRQGSSAPASTFERCLRRLRQLR